MSRETFFKALACETRLKILDFIPLWGDMDVTTIHSELQKRQGSISLPAVSQHLKILVEAGLLVFEKRAQRRCYRFASDKVSNVIGEVLSSCQGIMAGKP